jgi:hypothetical protein
MQAELHVRYTHLAIGPEQARITDDNLIWKFFFDGCWSWR